MKFHFDPLCFEEVIWNRSSQPFLVLSGEVSRLATHARRSSAAAARRAARGGAQARWAGARGERPSLLSSSRATTVGSGQQAALGCSNEPEPRERILVDQYLLIVMLSGNLHA